MWQNIILKAAMERTNKKESVVKYTKVLNKSAKETKKKKLEL